MWVLDIPAEDIKTKRPIEYPISAELSGRIDFYLNRIRPQIPGARTHDYLWASSRGRPMGDGGFRLHAPINRSDYYDEVAVFLGASYFRAVAKGQTYGLSARGLAINTGMRRGRSFLLSKHSGLKSRNPERTLLSFTHCWTAQALLPPIALLFDPAKQPCSTLR